MPRILTIAGVAVIAGVSAAGYQQSGAGDPTRSLSTFVAETRTALHLPGLAVVVVHADGAPQVFVSGERRLGRGDAITPEDRMHWGSLTKAITSTVVGALVERGRMTFDTTIGETFPELAAGMRPEYRSVTVRQLLAHASGIQPYHTDDAMNWTTKLAGAPAEQERTFLVHVLAEKSRFPAGTQHEYSNAGGAIAGMMAERAGGRPYEALVEDLVFAPLGGHAAFGNPGLDAAGQPWGHVQGHLGRVTEVAPTDREYIVPRVFEAAGDASVTLKAYGTFLQLHLRGLLGLDGVLKASTVEALHAPVPPLDPATAWSLGWGTTTIDGVRSEVHAGSNGAYIALATIQPSRDLAFAIVTNVGGGDDLLKSLSELRPQVAARAAQ